MSYFINAIVLLIKTVVEIYIYVLLLRFILQKLGANYFNQIVQILIKLTNPIVKPLSKVLPRIKGYDLAIAVPTLVLQFLILWLVMAIVTSGTSITWGVILATLGELGSKLTTIYLVTIIAQAIASWVPQFSGSPLITMVHMICSPITRRVQRLVPAIGGIDISPILILIVLYIINRVIFTPMIAYGLSIR